VVPPEQLSYIVGNPPFLGSSQQSPEQTNQVASVLSAITKVRTLDFVAAWYGKATDMMKLNPAIETALVSTNSITQGEQVGILWKYLLEQGVKINFAHQTFKWTNDAKGKAAVHCVIIGFALHDKSTKWIYEYPLISAEPTEREVENINPYLFEGHNVLVQSRTKSICLVPNMVKGSQPTDGGNLLLSDIEKNELAKIEPDALRYVKRFVGSDEFINAIPRWCLWLVNVNPSELRSLPEVLKRVEGVRSMRLASKKEQTRNFALTPTIFTEIRQPSSDYVVIPRVSSERRSYIPIGFLSKEIIASDGCLIIPNAKVYDFGVLTSKMHMAWVRYTCGRLKSDYRYSKDIVYNNFPWPGCGARESITDTAREKIEACAQAVLDARAEFPNSSLADLYDPRTMPPVLAKAHTALDRAVDEAYGFKLTQKSVIAEAHKIDASIELPPAKMTVSSPQNTDAQRIAFLFDLYQKITTK
jgi:hypothetical protein